MMKMDIRMFVPNRIFSCKSRTSNPEILDTLCSRLLRQKSILQSPSANLSVGIISLFFLFFSFAVAIR